MQSAGFEYILMWGNESIDYINEMSWLSTQLLLSFLLRLYRLKVVKEIVLNILSPLTSYRFGSSILLRKIMSRETLGQW